MDNNLIYNFGSLMLPNNIIGLPPELKYKGNHFFIKDEFHVTILSVKDYVPLVSNKFSISEKDAEEKILEIVKKFLSIKKLTFDYFSGQLRIAEENDKKTIVAMCLVIGIEEFFDDLNTNLSLDIPLPPTHVTIYTLRNKKPIGLINNNELTELTKIVEGKELEVLKKEINFNDLKVNI